MARSEEFVFTWDPFWQFVTDDYSVATEDAVSVSSHGTDDSTTMKKRNSRFSISFMGRQNASRDGAESRFENENERGGSDRHRRRPNSCSRTSRDNYEKANSVVESRETFDNKIVSQLAAVKDFDDDIFWRVDTRNDEPVQEDPGLDLWNFFDLASERDQEDSITDYTDEESVVTHTTTSTTNSEQHDSDLSVASSVDDFERRVQQTQAFIDKYSMNNKYLIDKPCTEQSTARPAQVVRKTETDQDDQLPTQLGEEVTLVEHRGEPNEAENNSAEEEDLQMTTSGSRAENNSKRKWTMLVIKRRRRPSTDGNQEKHTQGNWVKASSVREPREVKYDEDLVAPSKTCMPLPVWAINNSDGTSDPIQHQNEFSRSKASSSISSSGRAGLNLFHDDHQDSAVARKSCMVINCRQTSTEAQQSRLAFEKLVCGRRQALDVARSAAARDENSHSSFPQVRIVSDTKGPHGTIDGSGENRSPFMKQMMLPESLIASVAGPQSIFTYEYDKCTRMDVRYKKFGDDPIALLSVRQYNSPQTTYCRGEVVIKVEASTISMSDCSIRRGLWWGSEAAPLPNTPGVDVLGFIDQIDTLSSIRYRLSPGDRVMSLIKWGGNSRYARVPVEQLVKVPDSVDPAQAVCLAESYLAAFQALTHTLSAKERYAKQSLVGRSILVVGALSPVGTATIDLARALGAMEVFAVGKQRHHELLSQLRATPLGRRAPQWPNGVSNMMDLVIDTVGDVDEEHATIHHFKALNDQGDLIFVGLRNMAERVATEWDAIFSLLDEEIAGQVINRIHSLEVFDCWELELERSKLDLKFLLRLLAKGRIAPVVRDRLPLDKVSKAQALLETKRIQGYLVCEPFLKSKSRAVYL